MKEWSEDVDERWGEEKRGGFLEQKIRDKSPGDSLSGWGLVCCVDRPRGESLIVHGCITCSLPRCLYQSISTSQSLLTY